MSLFSSIIVDDSQWPLLLVRFEGLPSRQQFEEYLARRTECVERQAPHVVLLDTLRAWPATAELRAREAEWLQEHEPLLRELLLGTAYFITSPPMRLSLSLLLHRKTLPSPYLVVSSLKEGVEWAAARCEEAGLVPEAWRIRHHFGLGAGALMGDELGR
jgi:hypothetical protein